MTVHYITIISLTPDYHITVHYITIMSLTPDYHITGILCRLTSNGCYLLQIAKLRSNVVLMALFKPYILFILPQVLRS